jgi:hypothetical protein
VGALVSRGRTQSGEKSIEKQMKSIGPCPTQAYLCINKQVATFDLYNTIIMAYCNHSITYMTTSFL